MRSSAMRRLKWPKRLENNRAILINIVIDLLDMSYIMLQGGLNYMRENPNIDNVNILQYNISILKRRECYEGDRNCQES